MDAATNGAGALSARSRHAAIGIGTALATLNLSSRLKSLAGHRLVRNSAALYGVQAAHFVFPLITLPYLARVLRPAEFGLVLLAQSTGSLVNLLIDYGFGGSAVRRTAQARDDGDVLADAVAGVLGAKTVLTLGSGVIVVFALALSPLQHHPGYLLLAWLGAVASGLNPWWYFLALERLPSASAIEVVTRGIAVVLTLVWVRTTHDGWKVLLLVALGSLAGLALVTWRVYREVAFRLPRRSLVIDALRDGWYIFAATVAVTLYTAANVMILGFFVTTVQVAFFAGPERIVRAILRLTGPLVQAVYPRISLLVSQGENRRARRLAKVAVLAIVVPCTVGAMITFVLAGPIVDLVLGPGYGPAVAVLRILVLIVPVVALGSGIGVGWLLPNRLDRTITRTVAVGGVLNLALAPIAAPILGPVGMALAVLAAESTVMVLILVAARRSGVFALSEPAQPAAV